MIVALLGYRGSGKTTVGRLLARRLGCTFLDLDEAIASAAGKTIREIFAAGGESEFRRVETEALLKALQTDGQVLSLGGGAVLAQRNQDLLRRNALTRVYLQADAETLCARILADSGTTANRPALTALGGGADEIRHLLTVREPIYRLLATQTLDATQPPEALVNQIVHTLPSIANP
jgi:shikimate kinase